MIKDLSVKLVESDDDLLDVALLKKADDSECCKEPVSEELVLDKIMRLNELGSNFWIAKVGEIPVGYAIGCLRKDFYSSQGVYVSPDYRRKGIGLKLKQFQVDFASVLGCERISTWVYSLNQASIGLQRKAGFELISTDDGYQANLDLK